MTKQTEIRRGIDNTAVYIDGIGVFFDSWDSHILKLDMILGKLEKNNFIINPRNCEWTVKETDWSGHWLTPEGVTSWNKNVDAIFKMKAPSNATELRTFLGVLKYYRGMWPRRSHILAPFTVLSDLPK